MPCQSDYLDHGSCERAEEEVDELTQNLCFLCGELVYIGQLDILSPRISDWWERHQQSDTRRVRQQMLNVVGNHQDAKSLARFFLENAERVHPVSRWHAEWFQRVAHEVWAEKTKKKRDKEKH